MGHLDAWYPPATMRWTCTLCLTILALPALAGAQTEEAPIEIIDDDPAGDDTVAEEEGPPPGDLGTIGPGDGAGGREPATASASIVVDDRAAELRREQEEMVAEHLEGTRGDDDEQDESESLDHELQLGIRVGAGVPFFFGLRYSGGPRCDDSNPMDPNTFCVGVGSGIIDFDLSFGVSADVEIVVLGRIGMIGVEPTEQNNIQIGIGVRAYMSPASIFKVYLAPALILDLTPAGTVMSDWGDVDFGVRGAFGFQVDIVRYVGLFIELGVNILFVRSFGIGPYATGGFQIRFP